MTMIGQAERITQQRVVAFFVNTLGYEYLGNWQDRPDNRPIETELVRTQLRRRGYTDQLSNRAIDMLSRAAAVVNDDLYTANKRVYELLRYGIPVKESPNAPTQTVKLVDWDVPAQNHFGIAEEVTLRGDNERRPDIVLYLNGIAIVTLELKNARTSVETAIRQTISNQQPLFNRWFYSTVQLVLAGNDSQGLRYATIDTPEKYWLQWQEDAHLDDGRSKLDKYLGKLCAKPRLLELINDFILFDGGIKKVPRTHQYFGVKAAQQRIMAGHGGIIWHTQGSGKSIVMVLLAQWILAHKPNARIAVITDRDELDKQIEQVFNNANTPMVRASSGNDLLDKLQHPLPRLLCALIHKFGSHDSDFEGYIAQLHQQPQPVYGDLYVFVDECHRTQSGRLHKAMKTILPNAVFIGFTGTPLLQTDAQTTYEVFGDYIHTYKFNEAVADGVVLDLVYDARDIAQTLTSPERVDIWFDAKTQGLNEWQKQALREQWATMQRVLSSRSRMENIVQDIVFDFATKPRLTTQRGTAMLVANSIYEACRYYELFGRTELAQRCAVITSYQPNANDITLEDSGHQYSASDKQFVYTTYTQLLSQSGQGNTEQYEDWAKRLFIKEPARMKLLIVVDKLLTGFDAPSCTYLYIDKKMQNHGLFQAICRTNRLDGDDKQYGYVVDYKDLFTHVTNALKVYTVPLDDKTPGGSPAIEMQARLKIERQNLEAALESLFKLCEPVPHPKDDVAYIQFFCGNTEDAQALTQTTQVREILYKSVAKLLRCYAAIANQMSEAGYSASQIADIKRQVESYVRLREILQHASGEYIDLKAYEPDMRRLIDTYITASAPQAITDFDNYSLMELITHIGAHEAITMRLQPIKDNKNAIADTMAHNARATISLKSKENPQYYRRMSEMLDEIIQQLRQQAIEYGEFLRKMSELAKQIVVPTSEIPYPIKALYDNLSLAEADCRQILEERQLYVAQQDAKLDVVRLVDHAILHHRQDNWRNNQAKENIIKGAVFQVIKNVSIVEELFPIIKARTEY